MQTLKTQVAVLGAGPAGAIAARQLGRAGVEVIFIDPCMPLAGHRVESFPASGAPLADEIGLLPVFCENSFGPAEAMHMVWRDLAEVRAFEGNGPLLLQRAKVHAALRQEAIQHATHLRARVRRIETVASGVRVFTDDATVQCQLIIDARGRSAIKRASTDLIALPFSASIQRAPHSMCLEAMADGWIWATVQPDQSVQGAVFQKASQLAGRSASARAVYAQKVLKASVLLGDISALQVGTPMPAGLSAVDSPIVADTHILIGDAALARDPIASHGWVHAMRSAVQASVAAQTLLDPATDSQAAFAFLRHKHREAVGAAKLATARAYKDQTRFNTAFWNDTPPHQPAPPSPEIASGPVCLSSPLTRAAVLGGDRIRWAAAIALPASGDFFTSAGPVSALDIASACRPPAPLQDIAARLSRLHDTPTVFEVLEHLALGGAFSQARRSI